jgi:hypothetical protein
MVVLQYLIIFVEVPNHTVGYQNHFVGSYHFGRPRLCIQRTVAQQTHANVPLQELECLLCMRASSGPPWRLPAPYLTRNTNQHFNTFSVFYWDISPFPDFFLSNLSGDFKYPSPDCRFFLYKYGAVYLTLSLTWHSVFLHAVSGERRFPDRKQVINQFQNCISTSEEVQLSCCYSWRNSVWSTRTR